VIKSQLFCLVVLISFLAGCNQGSSAEEIAKLAYEWEKAYFDTDYEREQELLYEEGTFEVHKSREKRDSGLKYEDIRYEVYYDRGSEQYYVFLNFKNPVGENSIEDELLIRKKNGEWKIDKGESMEIDRKKVSEEFEREACINCE
jgi:hypothetical protein